jgi:hypothetical protein
MAERSPVSIGKPHNFSKSLSFVHLQHQGAQLLSYYTLFLIGGSFYENLLQLCDHDPDDALIVWCGYSFYILWTIS